MTTASKCRAQGGPENCTDPNCPAKRAQAARIAAFMAHPAQGGAKGRAPATLGPMSTTAHLSSIAPAALFEAEIAAKYINVQHHPALPLDVYDYAQITQFQRHWNAATLAARGLIVNRETKEIVARPFSKFFNYGEAALAEAELTGPISVTDKLDGSMGTGYSTPEGLAIATRGSFQSEQALHATAVYRARYHGKWAPRADVTYIWEIIYPANRIVLNYGELDDIVLIAGIETATGRSIPAAELPEWPGRKVQTFEFDSMADALGAEPRADAEGYVVHYRDSDTRVKIKQEDYVRLHRIMTGVNSRRIWELLIEGGSIESFLQDVPEEFEKFVRETDAQLRSDYAGRMAEIERRFAEVNATLGEVDQKTFAQHVMRTYSKAQAFQLLDARKGSWERISKFVWLEVKPEFERSFFSAQGQPKEQP